MAYFVVFSLTLMYELFRHIPFLKCVTACKIKKKRLEWANEKLLEMCHFHYYTPTHISLGVLNGKLIKLNCENYKTKQLEKIYKYSEPFSCRSYKETEEWVVDARNMLKNEIADRHLLELM